MPKYNLSELRSLPNLLTCFRFVAAPVLLWFAWSGQSNAFFILLAITFLSDVLDGMAARLLNQESELGALLDSAGDLLIYITMATSIWSLWPEIVHREIVYIIIGIVSFALPVIVGLIKFHRFTSYHTWLVKIAVIAMGTSFFILFIFDIAWPFRIAVLIGTLAAIEEVFITFYIPTLRSNVHSLWHLKKR